MVYLEFIRIWLKHRQTRTTKRHYARYRPGELLDVACVMANLEGKFISYDVILRACQTLNCWSGLLMPSEEPLWLYFPGGSARVLGAVILVATLASADKLPTRLSLNGCGLRRRRCSTMARPKCLRLLLKSLMPWKARSRLEAVV